MRTYTETEQTVAPRMKPFVFMPGEGSKFVVLAVAGSARLCYIDADFGTRLQNRGWGGLRVALLRRGMRAEQTERVDVSESASVSTGIAGRYATAVFEMAKEDKAVKKLEGDIDALSSAIAESADLRALINSPVYSRGEMSKAVAGLAKAMKLTPLMTNTLGLMAENRRLFVLPHLMTALRGLIADEKGEVTAEVTSAKALTKAQSDKLAKALKASVGKDVKINAAVDENLIGGLVIKVGSKMIDTSIRSKLGNLQNAMKEVG